MVINSSGLRYLKTYWKTLVIILVFLVLIAAGHSKAGFPSPDSSTFQAVFLANGQAYFGKMTSIKYDYIRLDEVHYLVANPQSNDASEQERSKKSQLVKLGGEVHGPLGYMYIPKKQILFWEDLSPDSKIVAGMRVP